MDKVFYEKELSTMGELVTSLEARLPELAHNVITEYLDDDAAREHFLRDPDDPNQHEPRWHQFGIVTHNRRAVAAHQAETPGHLDQWGLTDKIGSYLERPIDGVPCAELLSVGLLFHDIGKFAARSAVEKEGLPAFTFGNHERFSGAIVRSNLFGFLAAEFDMSPSQREYIATCGERHFDLGVLRKAAKESPEGYTIAFTSSDNFRDSVQHIQGARPTFAPEIGLLFLADNLSKTDIRMAGVESDTDIENQSADMPQVISERGLNPGLIKAVRQLPVNVAVAQKYLEVWDTKRTNRRF